MNNQQETLEERIDVFIKKKHEVSDSNEFDALKGSADSAVKHGFGQASNVRYANFLATFREEPELAAKYKEAYPNSSFLPWAALHAVMKSMNLWLDLPKHYLGAVPDEQLPWMDLFELNKEDCVRGGDILALLQSKEGSNADKAIKNAFDRGFQKKDQSELDQIEVANEIRVDSHAWTPRNFEYEYSLKRRIMELDGVEDVIKQCIKDVESSFFVVAPSDAFGVEEDFIARFRKANIEMLKPKIPPNDPLVIRFVKGGCLIVAAWGDEGARMNQIAEELSI